jgi:tetratricopeptide (TPR) repeat protein
LLLQPLIIAALVALTIGGFAATTFLVRWYRSTEARFGQQWFGWGEAALQAGDAQSAVRYFRSAVHYSHDSPRVRLRLAEALAAAGRTEEAEAYLRSLWEDEPDHGLVNLELARLRAQKNDVSGALRYFHGAIYGSWAQDPDLRRREARFELIAFLMRRGEKEQADAELLGLAAELPPDARLHTRVGELFLEAGNSARALNEFKAALALDRRSPPALAGAGEASFRLGEYWTARRYLEQAMRRQRTPELQRRMQMVNLIVGLDPYVDGLGAEERAERVRRALQIAGDRLQSCAADRHIDLQNATQAGELVGYYQQLKQFERESKRPDFSQKADLQDHALTLAGSIEDSATRTCGPPEGADLALVLLQRHEENAPR